MKSRNRGSKRKRRVKANELIGFLVLGLLMIFVVYLIIPPQTFHPENPQSSSASASLSHSNTVKPLPRAAIVDQLSMHSPNREFMEGAEGLMQMAGFEVDVYSPERVTVSFYGSLAGRGYRLIVFRVHAGVNENVKDRPVGLFTTEIYSQYYPQEQLEDLVGSAQAFNRSEVVFAVTPKFIRERSITGYDGAVIILMGCFGLYSQDLPQAFIDRGASLVIGWNGLVDVKHTDKATLRLLRIMLLEKASVDESVTATTNEMGRDSSGSILGYYPHDSGDLRLVPLFSGELLTVHDRHQRRNNLLTSENQAEYFSYAFT